MDRVKRTIKPLSIMAANMAEEVEKGKRTKDIYRVQAEEFKKRELSADIARARETVGTRVRVCFDDPDDVRRRISDYLAACEMAGVFPTTSGLSCHGFGVSRQATNQYMLKNPNTESTRLIRLAKECFTDVLVNAGLRNNANQIMAIFELKNQSGYSDKLQIEPVQSGADVDSIGTDELRMKYLEMDEDEQ